MTARSKVHELDIELSATLSATREAISAALNRAQRRTVLTMSTLMVASGVVVVLAARLAS